MRQRLLKIGVAVATAVLTLCLVGCGESPEEKADTLYENNSYKEALEIYNTLDNKDDDAVSSKISDCQFWLFINYVRDKGSVTIERSDHSTALPKSTKIEARENGDIKLTYIDSDYTSFSSQNTGVANTTTYNMLIPHQGKEADVNGTYKTTTSGANATQTAKGILDIGTYRMGDTIIWDDYNDSASTSRGLNAMLGINMLESNGKDIQAMINDLSNCLTKSSTGCKLKTIGFDKL